MVETISHFVVLSLLSHTRQSQVRSQFSRNVPIEFTLLQYFTIPLRKV